ncbi:MAG TPA: T9SS type A sorting domain-containing protein [Agriterribacter sp.]|nr:T9SS type A sorting domain-containing protein [Chitinophagaceae bacterium]HRP33209.1 T9SS type A sorting domain-containing protein [Agriterribacter sp.]
MKSILLFVIALLTFEVTVAQYIISPGELSAGTHNDVSDPLGTVVPGLTYRKGAVKYNHTNHSFSLGTDAGWLTQFSDGPLPSNWGTTSTNTDYFLYQGTNTIAGTDGIALFDTVHFDIGAGNIMQITNNRQGILDQPGGEVSGGIIIGRALHFNNGITTTDRQKPVNSAIVFVNNAFYTGGLTDAQHVDGFVSEVNYLFGDNTPFGHGGDFTFPVGNGAEVYQLRRVGTFNDGLMIVTVGWVDGDPGATTDPTQGAINPTTPGSLGTGISAVVPVGFWDWHVQDGENLNPGGSEFGGAESLAENQTITVSIPALDGILLGGNASDLRLIGYDAVNFEWKNLGTAGATGLTKGSTLSGIIPAGTTITALAIGSINNIILPVNFKSFTATATGCAASLQWQTGMEQNNSHFIVERSTNGTDFTAIGRVKAVGNSNNTSTYTFTDAAPANGVNYYRITQADFNGKQSSSEVRIVRIQCGNGAVVKAYPNPTAGRVTIQDMGKSVMQVNVIAANGQTVVRYAPTQNQSNTITLNLQQIPNGIYLLQMINKDGTIEVIKLLKQ